MGKLLLIALVAAAVGGAAVYGVMLYLGRAPLTVDEIVSRTPKDTVELAAERPAETIAPTQSAPRTPSAGSNPISPSATPTGTGIGSSTSASAATTTRTVGGPTEREIIVRAFASCGGSYSGNEYDFRALAAESAIDEGRQSVADLRALVEEHCGGVFPDMTPVAVASHDRVAPTATTVHVRMATPTPVPTATRYQTISPTPTISELRFEVSALEREVHRLINAERKAQQIPELGWDAELGTIARSHSEDMASSDYFDHTNLKGEAPTDRGNNAGYPCIKQLGGGAFSYGLAENIWYGWEYSSLSYGTFGTRYDWMTQTELAHQAVSSWMNSPGHRSNILDAGYDRAGIGVGLGIAGGERYAVYMTQVFC